MLIIAIRSYAQEFGIVASRGRYNVEPLAKIIADRDDERIPPIARDVLQLLVRQLRDTDKKLTKLEDRLMALAKWQEDCRRLITIPGIDPMTATAL